MTFLQTPRDRASFLILVLGAAILLALSPFFSGLMGAAVLYVVFVKPYRFLERAMKPGLAATLTLVAALLVIALPLAWLIGVVIGEAPGALQSLQSSSVFSRVGQLRIGSVQVGAELAKASGTIVSWLSARTFSFVGSATSADSRVDRGAGGEGRRRDHHHRDRADAGVRRHGRRVPAAHSDRVRFVDRVRGDLIFPVVLFVCGRGAHQLTETDHADIDNPN